MDPKAVAAVFEHYYPAIYRYLFYRVRTAQDAEDLAGEVFVRVVKSLGRQSGNFEAWLYAIARNALTDHYRRKAVRKENSMPEEALESLPAGAGAGGSPFTPEELKVAIAELTEEQRQVVTLRFLEGYDNERTARITGKTVGAVKALQFRALLALKEILRKG